MQAAPSLTLALAVGAALLGATIGCERGRAPGMPPPPPKTTARPPPAEDAAATSDAASTGGVRRLVLGSTAEPPTLCPLVFNNNPQQGEIAGLIARTLVQYDPTWTLIPDLAETLPRVTETSDLRMTADWAVRSDARWEDGTPVSVRDVMLTWRIQSDPKKQDVMGRGEASRIADIVPANDGTTRFQVVWSRPVPFADAPRVHVPLAAHVLEGDLLDATGALRPLADHARCRQPLSNGPFAIASWTPGEEIVFKRNPHASPRPKLDEVVVRFFASEQALEAAMIAGSVDVSLPGSLSSMGAVRFARRNSDQFTLLSAAGHSVAHLDFNLEHPILKDVRVRQAFAAAIPRAQLVEKLTEGAYAVLDSYLPPRHWGHAPVDAIVYDPVRAAALLDDVGFHVPPGGGVRVRTDGAALRFTLHAANTEDVGEMISAIRDHLKNVGIEITIEQRPMETFAASVQRDWASRELTMYGWVVEPSQSSGSFFREDRIPIEKTGFTGMNTMGYRNTEVTRLLKEVDRSADPDLRRANLARVQQLIRRDLPVLPLYNRRIAIVARKGVRNVRPTGTITSLAWNAAQWDVDPAPAP